MVKEFNVVIELDEDGYFVASVPVLGLPSFGAAAASRAGSISQIPTSLKRGLATKVWAWCIPRLPIPTTMTL